MCYCTFQSLEMQENYLTRVHLGMEMVGQISKDRQVQVANQTLAQWIVQVEQMILVAFMGLDFGPFLGSYLATQCNIRNGLALLALIR